MMNTVKRWPGLPVAGVPWLLLLLAFTTAVEASEAGRQGHTALLAGSKPNILFIFADDWGWGDLGCHGHPYLKTPHIDRLAREGTDFHRFTVASPVCSPSRTAVLTGRFPARYNIDGHFAWPRDNARRNMPDWLDPELPTLPRLLRSAGYATAHFGKWHLSNDMIPDGPVPSAYGYDEYGAFNCAGEQMPFYEDVERAVAFIEKSQSAGRPFFINLWIHEPHTPFHVLPKFRHRFPELSEGDNIYAATLAHADERIGHVLEALERLDLTTETLVIFSSDNGPARNFRDVELGLMYDTATGAGFNIAAAKGLAGEHRGFKGSLLQGGISVPFIARWPGRIPAGRVDDRSLISAVDLLPTFCELAGVSMPEEYSPDGVSQVAVLAGTTRPERLQPLFWKFPTPWPADTRTLEHWATWAVLYGKWKLLVSRDNEHQELYDVRADPFEKTDLKASHAAVAEELFELIQQWRATLPDRPDARLFSEERTSS